MKINIIFFIYFNVLNLRFYLIYSSEKQSFVIILCVFDDASGKVNSIYLSLLTFESSKLEGIDLFHDIESELDKLFICIVGLMVEQRGGHSIDSLEILVFTRCKLSRFNVYGLSDKFIVIFTDCVLNN